MRKLLLSIVAVSAALVAPGPAAAKQPAQAHHRDTLPSTLDLRLRSIEIEIDIMADRQMIGRDEARDLRQQSHRLQQRLYGMSRREQADVELAVDRLQQRLRFAADGARLGDYASSRRELGRFDDGDRYRRDGDYYDRDTFQRPDPRGDPFAKWEERDDRDQGIAISPR